MSISESQDNSIFVGVQREYYESGKLKSEVFVNAGKKEGEYKDYYDYDYDKSYYDYDKSYYDNDNDNELSKDSINSSEQLFRIGNYIDDKLQGECREYYVNGELSVICNYINHKLQGEYKSYYDNRELLEICNYINDKKEGEYKSYYENGKLLNICNYINDKNVSKSK